MMSAMLLLLLAEPVADPLVAEMQQLESSRNAAIRGGNIGALEKIYAPGFHGIAANGTRVDRDALFTIFRRNAGGDFTADSRVLSANVEGELVLVEGRLKLAVGSSGQLISDSHYLHVFRRNGDHWEMIEGAAVPIAQPPR